MGQLGAQNPNWKGGRTVASHGYVLIKNREHPRANVSGYVYEHILVAEKKLGRFLLPGEQVHHIDHDRGNNDPTNLQVMASAAHHHKHHRKVERGLREPDEPNTIVTCECGCGKTFAKYDSTNRPRRFVSGHNLYVKKAA